jgi:hypothetical protein
VTYRREPERIRRSGRHGQQLGVFYGRADPNLAEHTGFLTMDGAQQMVAAIFACVSGANAQTVSGKNTQTSDTTNVKICRMAQQCHWENFKKICTWVKVCR